MTRRSLAGWLACSLSLSGCARTYDDYAWIETFEGCSTRDCGFAGGSVRETFTGEHGLHMEGDGEFVRTIEIGIPPGTRESQLGLHRVSRCEGGGALDYLVVAEGVDGTLFTYEFQPRTPAFWDRQSPAVFPRGSAAPARLIAITVRKLGEGPCELDELGILVETL